MLFLRLMKNQTLYLFTVNNPGILFSSVYGIYAAFLFGRRAGVKEIVTKPIGVEGVFRMSCNFQKEWEVKLSTLERKYLQQGNSDSSFNWEAAESSFCRQSNTTWLWWYKFYFRSTQEAYANVL